MAKTILITGASSGIGRAAAKRFEREGWNVLATMPDMQAPHGLVESDHLIIAPLDVRDVGQCSQAVATATARFGQIDALLSNAGYGQYGAFEAISSDQIQNQFAVNVFGAMNVLRAVLPGFRTRGQGLVLVTSSAGAKVGLPTSELYISSKFALEGFFESIWYELRAVGISVKLIEPGGVDSGFHKVADRLTAAGGGIEAYENLYGRIVANRDRIIASGELVSSDDVATAIFAAATDGTSRLRYLVGEDAEHLDAAVRNKPEAEVLGMIARQYGLSELAPDAPATNAPH
ncbi:SDR family NAD(P)-dependent oxidoreductase [Glacieibacterium frigidum]|uniref:SDR family NAD(P)-dependent oxidoreductase n=1 Tax=Glacieibacterium frigidum TaxID=2593303 RepID=A0A552U880_9SPHN|nr:SDR family NAD(P)-dependent oxidoreductase [Glacieibacterium frigidum]TRW14411.1 SDR family NAD(P)-dependent oxidoreductase [Glacieibacterium frigidum]